MNVVLRFFPVYLGLLMLVSTRTEAADTVKKIVFPLPLITMQPTNRTASIGERVEFRTTVVGTMITGYQWHKDGSPVSGATTQNYIIPSARKTHAGKYRLEVRSAGGSRFSSNATLNVVCEYTLSSNATFITFEGGTRTFSVTASGECGWRATTTNSWINITSGATNSRSGQVTITVQPNNSNTARNGFVKIGSKQFMVAQGVEFAPATLRSKTLAVTVENGTGSVATNGNFIFRGWGQGTNFFFSLAPGTTNISSTNIFGDYAYSKTGPKSARLSFLELDYTLAFNDTSLGEYTATNSAGDTQTGTFKLARATADFNIDGFADLFTQSTSTGTNIVTDILMAGISSGLEFRLLTLTSLDLQAVGIADFNADDFVDVWLRTPEGVMGVFPISGTGGANVARPIAGGRSAGLWKTAGVADFNSDEKPDILFQHRDRRVAIWFLNGTNFVSSTVLRNGEAAATGWRVVGSGDMNGDRQMDVIFQNDNGRLAAWLMNERYFVRSQSLLNTPAPPSGAKVVAVGDYNEDGHIDIVWQTSSNQLIAWFMNNMTFVRQETFFEGDALPAGKKIIGPK